MVFKQKQVIEFETIRREIIKYKLSSLLSQIFELLKAIQKDQESRYPFWRIFVFIKWSYIHTKDVQTRRAVTQEELQDLLSLIGKFESNYKGICFNSKIDKIRSIKIIAFQQFPFQDPYKDVILERQITLFLNFNSGFNIENAFKEHTGIDLIEFCRYCYFTYMYLNLDKGDKEYCYTGMLHSDYFQVFSQVFTITHLKKFLRLLSILTVDDFDGLHKLQSEILQLYETNFFICKPFICFRNEYKLPHRALFLQTLSHFIYTYLKSNEPKFSEEFGYRLEKYVELGLKENGIEYLNEIQLQKKYNLSKVSDFLTEENILIEVKATELHPRSGVSRNSNTMAADFKSSIVKAYTQLLSTANSIDNTKKWFGLIITYKEMYLGFGANAWDEFLEEPIEEFMQKSNISIDILPPTSLFFISISDWDWIVQAIKESKAKSLKEILLKGKEHNLIDNISDATLLLEQVLTLHYQTQKSSLSYLKEAKEILDFTK